MPTQPHMPPPHAGAVGLSPLWRRAQAPHAACGTPTAASAVATPTAAAAAATHHMCRRHAHGRGRAHCWRTSRHAGTLLPLLPVLLAAAAAACCRCLIITVRLHDFCCKKILRPPPPYPQTQFTPTPPNIFTDSPTPPPLFHISPTWLQKDFTVFNIASRHFKSGNFQLSRSTVNTIVNNFVCKWIQC